MPTAPLTPAECFAALLAWLTHAVATRGITGQLSNALVNLLVGRIREIKQRIGRIAARVGAGRYAPRRVSAPRRQVVRPRRPNPLPQRVGWLVTFVPEAIVARAQLEALFRDARVVELIAAAPATLRRPLRSLCRMLGAEPPAILALPAHPRPPRKTSPPPEAPPPAAPTKQLRRRHRPLARICGPPQPA